MLLLHHPAGWFGKLLALAAGQHVRTCCSPQGANGTLHMLQLRCCCNCAAVAPITCLTAPLLACAADRKHHKTYATVSTQNKCTAEPMAPVRGIGKVVNIGSSYAAAAAAAAAVMQALPCCCCNWHCALTLYAGCPPLKLAR
jgi:hypothetical protein